MFLDRFGNTLKIGDKINVDDVTFTKCKETVGWKILGFLEHHTANEVVAIHTSEEVASFHLLSVSKIESIKKFLNHIAPRGH